MSDTHAYLPVDRVVAAARAVLDEIDAERDEIYEDIVQARRQRAWWPRRSRKTAAESLSREDVLPASCHRVDDEEVCGDIVGLAEAVALEGCGLTIYVSAADFAVIREEYMRRAREEADD